MAKKWLILKKKYPGNRHLPRDLQVIYQDDDIIVIDKPAGLLTVGTATDRTRTAQHILTEYVKKGSSKSRNRVFVVHRLDQWTSGVLIFAKSEEMKFRLQENWPTTEKIYVTIVHGKLKDKEGTVSSYLTENSAYTVYSTKDASKGKLSHTQYKVIKESENFSLLEINLLTGRKNQIRVHMSDIGHPIVGDRKYGLKQVKKIADKFRRLALHAKSISFSHPASGEKISFSAKPPTYFKELMK